MTLATNPTSQPIIDSYEMKFTAYTESDKQEIQHLFTETFSDSANRAEGELIGQLVLDLMNNTGARDISGFVVTEHERIIGCIFFTRLTFDTPVEAFLLSPVAVDTKYQGRGIGQRLINFGLDQYEGTGRETGLHLW
ncbi:N-acetyltransferase [Thiohalobacter thiocyanaticus]|uniref:N-acetyltransferase n=1 Tax=Thiohalobacter thiocyanaticus TaxID=585455 RepID=A0A1Z4VLN7_9GAMM|nr:GNAT family N-acetyltransferase [Thiohalobacter thiocyanaticus]BAZ92510.1 N-acetyltransferase [Thiohalobacter thiocyanaticus]